MLSNYFKRFLVSIIREIIPNNSYKLLPEKSFILWQQYYQTTNCKQYLQVLFREFSAYGASRPYSTFITDNKTS